jgi:Coenzyme PQQ synthesis protein D (PqqD)
MTRTELETTPLRPSQDVVARRIAGEHLLVPVRNGAAQMDYIYVSNEVGSFVFALLDGRRTARHIARELAREFEVSEEDARHDVVDFLAALSESGLIVGDGSGA